MKKRNLGVVAAFAVFGLGMLPLVASHARQGQSAGERPSLQLKPSTAEKLGARVYDDSQCPPTPTPKQKE